MSPDLARLIEALETQLAAVAYKDAPVLIGELERIKSILLARMMSAAGSENGQPEAPAEDLHLLPVSKIAALLDLPKGRVYELIRQGQIPAVRVGEKNVRVPRAALREWIATHQKKGLDKTMYTAYSRRNWGERDDRRGASKNPKAPRADASGPGRSARRHYNEPRPLGARRGADPGADGPIHRTPGEDDDS